MRSPRQATISAAGGTGGSTIRRRRRSSRLRNGSWISSARPATTPAATASRRRVLTFTVSGGTVEDLAAAAGAGKGERHDRALKLIGSAIGRGGDLCEVARQAVEWGRRCSPPMDEDEILKIVSDLSQRQGTRPAARQAEKKPAKPPAPPAPWKPFPIEALPEPVRTVRRSAAAIGVDRAYIATALLPALAAAIGNSRQIILKRGWVEPSVLSGDHNGRSRDAQSLLRSTLRSSTFASGRRPRSRSTVEQWSSMSRMWPRHGRGVRRARLRRRKFVKPICERFSCSDVTVEGLAVLFADTWRGLLLIRDELAGWVGGFDRTKGGSGSDTAHWLTIHGARDLLVDRKSGDRKTIYVRRAAVSIVRRYSTGNAPPGSRIGAF